MVKQEIHQDVINEEISKYEMSHQTCTVVDVVPPHTAVKLQIYDSNIIDMATYVKTCRKYACFCHAIVVVYNVAQKRTFFNAINKWCQLIRTQKLSCNIFLVANKNDIKQIKHQVTSREAETIAQKMGLYFLEVSGFKGTGTEDLVAAITNVLYQRVVEKASTETRWPDIIASRYAPSTIRIFYTLMQVPNRVVSNPSKFDNDYTESALSASTTEEGEDEEEDYDPDVFQDLEEEEEPVDYVPEDEFYETEDPNAMEFVSLSKFSKKDDEYVQSLKLEENVVALPLSEISPVPTPAPSSSPLPSARRKHTITGSRASSPDDEFNVEASHQPTVQLASVSRKGRRKTKKYVNDTLLDEKDQESFEEVSHMSAEIDSEALLRRDEANSTDIVAIDGTGLNDAIIMQAMAETEQAKEGDKKNKKCIIA
jgi:GTPase SAR1 family protein